MILLTIKYPEFVMILVYVLELYREIVINSIAGYSNTQFVAITVKEEGQMLGISIGMQRVDAIQ
jgi:hypothetical protein